MEHAAFTSLCQHSLFNGKKQLQSCCSPWSLGADLGVHLSEHDSAKMNCVLAIYQLICVSWCLWVSLPGSPWGWPSRITSSQLVSTQSMYGEPLYSKAARGIENLNSFLVKVQNWTTKENYFSANTGTVNHIIFLKREVLCPKKGKPLWAGIRKLQEIINSTEKGTSDPLPQRNTQIGVNLWLQVPHGLAFMNVTHRLISPQSNYTSCGAQDQRVIWYIWHSVLCFLSSP